MNAIIILLALLLSSFVVLGVPLLTPPDVAFLYGGVSFVSCTVAVLVSVVLAGVASIFIRQTVPDENHAIWLLRIFAWAWLLRMLLAVVIFVFNLQGFFGGDAYTYDFFGETQLKVWLGDKNSQFVLNRFVGQAAGGASGWGMVYLIAALYGVIGRNMLAVQFVNAVIGSVTAPVIYLCSQHIFHNLRVARISALFVAFFPSLVLWSSQGLKDAPIVLLLSLSILATLKLGEKFSAPYLVTLLLSLLGLLTMRFYVFYMMVVAVGAAFAIGTRKTTTQTFLRQVIVIVSLCAGMMYFGVTRIADVQLEKFANLDEVQRSRRDAATTAESGFNQDADVRTASGFLTTLPIGITYLLFAPFPWQLASVRQSITLPEMLVWWLSFPALVIGVWFAVRYRFRQVLPILLFTVMLTLAYSVFQGNIGTAYRQRAQLLVFYFIFVAVGYTLFLEKREERRKQQKIK